MVKGTSRQVIVVHAPEEKLFDQAIFILKDAAVEKGITDEVLLKQAQQAIRSGQGALASRPSSKKHSPPAANILIWLYPRQSNSSPT